MSLQPQAALEAALRNAIRSELAYPAAQCDRTFDGRPPPFCGVVFAAVWSGGRRTQGRAGRTALDQIFTVAVTVTVRALQPFDRQVRHRDDVETRLNAITALGHTDSWGWRIISAANTLAGYRPAGVPDGISPVGFCEALAWESTDDCREAGGEWFAAAPSAKSSGVYQTVHFGRARHVQSIPMAQ